VTSSWECLQQVVLVYFGERHDTWSNGQHYTAADRPLSNQVTVCQAGWGSCRTCTTCCRHPHKDATRKTVPWNLSLTTGNCVSTALAMQPIKPWPSLRKPPRIHHQIIWYMRYLTKPIYWLVGYHHVAELIYWDLVCELEPIYQSHELKVLRSIWTALRHLS